MRKAIIEMVKETQETLDRKVTTKEKEILKLAVIHNMYGLNKTSEEQLKILVKLHNDISKANGEGDRVIKITKDGYTVDGNETSRKEAISYLDFESIGGNVRMTLKDIKAVRIAVEKENK